MKLIYIFFFNLFFIFVISQNDTIKTKPQNDTIKKKNSFSFFIGVDLANPIVGVFQDKKQYEIFASFKIKKKWYASVEIGHEENIFDNLGWNVLGKGFYARIGFDYHLSKDYQNPENSFFLGPRFGYSSFKETVNIYPINDPITDPFLYYEYGSLPETKGSAIWFEISAGGRVQLWNTKFYLEGQIKPKYILSQKLDNEIDALVIPGFGNDMGNFNIGFLIGLCYHLNFKK